MDKDTHTQLTHTLDYDRGEDESVWKQRPLKITAATRQGNKTGTKLIELHNLTEAPESSVCGGKPQRWRVYSRLSRLFSALSLSSVSAGGLYLSLYCCRMVTTSWWPKCTASSCGVFPHLYQKHINILYLFQGRYSADCKPCWWYAALTFLLSCSSPVTF